MIQKEAMIPLLVEATPSFLVHWREFQHDWKDTEMPYYIILGEFGQYLKDKMDKDETGEFSGIFKVIEQLHVCGDEYVREAATIGLLESIIDDVRFEYYLLPETEKNWRNLKEFWAGRRPFVGSEDE